MSSIESLLCFHDRRASDFGLMKIDDSGRVLSFSEKPKGDDLKAMVILENLTVSELNLLLNYKVAAIT